MDIPEDIRKQAVYYVGMMFAGVTLGKDIDRAAKIYAEAQQFCAEAIMAERERCTNAERERYANIADGFPSTILQLYERPGSPPGYVRRPVKPADIAAVIRRS